MKWRILVKRKIRLEKKRTMFAYVFFLLNIAVLPAKNMITPFGPMRLLFWNCQWPTCERSEDRSCPPAANTWSGFVDTLDATCNDVRGHDISKREWRKCSWEIHETDIEDQLHLAKGYNFSCAQPFQRKRQKQTNMLHYSQVFMDYRLKNWWKAQKQSPWRTVSLTSGWK